MPSLTFVTPAVPGKSITSTLLLLNSLREFGGELAENPVWILYPAGGGEFSDQEKAFLQELGAGLFPYQADQKTLRFPLGYKAQAAAVAEKLASGETELLAWLDKDTLILSPPHELLLPEGKCLAYRPVHHQLLGTSWGEDPGEFWQLVYQHTGADPKNDFRMITHAGEAIRPYFNAGSYVVRPERGILTQWWKHFQSAFQAPVFKTFYDRDPLYAVFLHQAILTGTIQSLVDRVELLKFNPSINYPLHLQGEIPEQQRAARIDDLVTVRYENLFDQDGWQEAVPFSNELAGWITSRLAAFRHLGEQA